MNILLLSLAASIPLAGLGYLAGRIADAIGASRRVRDAVWSLALLAPMVLAPLTLAIAQFDIHSPLAVAAYVEAAPALEAFAPTASVSAASPVANSPSLQTATNRPLPMGAILLTAYGLMAGTLWFSLGLRIRTLARRVRAAVPCGDGTVSATLSSAARRLRVDAPAVRIDAQGSSPLLVGLVRPVILLPASFVNAPSLAQVCGHELAHLKRRDNLRVIIEALLIHLCWFNPILRLIRVRLEACREEICDEMALQGEAAIVRGAYARALLEAFGGPIAPRPALAFGGARVRRRLTAIVAPSTPRPGTALVAGGLGAVIAAGLCGSGLALAAEAPLPTLRAAIAKIGERLDAPAPVQIAQVAAPAPPTSRIRLQIRVVAGPNPLFADLMKHQTGDGYAFGANPRLIGAYADLPTITLTPDKDLDAALSQLNRYGARVLFSEDRVVESGQAIRLDNEFMGRLQDLARTTARVNYSDNPAVRDYLDGEGPSSAPNGFPRLAIEPAVMTTDVRPVLLANGQVRFEARAEVSFPEFRPTTIVPDENGSLMAVNFAAIRNAAGQVIEMPAPGQRFNIEPTGQVLPAFRRVGEGRVIVANGGVFALGGVSYDRNLTYNGYLILIRATVEPATLAALR